VGATRLGNVEGVSGTGILLTVELVATAAGTSSLRFIRQNAFGPDGAPLPGVTWAAGTVQVTL
jgi:hypothetical protein